MTARGFGGRCAWSERGGSAVVGRAVAGRGVGGSGLAPWRDEEAGQERCGAAGALESAMAGLLVVAVVCDGCGGGCGGEA